MKHKLFSSTLALAMLASSLAFNPGPAQADTATTVVLDGNYAAKLLNAYGAGNTPMYPQKGTTAQHYIGTGAWESLPGSGSGLTRSKVELIIDPTAAPFSSLGSMTVADLASVSFATNKPGTSGPLSTNYYLVLYTTLDSCAAGEIPDRKWACDAITAHPSNVADGVWHTWSTSDPLLFTSNFSNNNYPSNSPLKVVGKTLAEFKAMPGNSGKTIRSINITSEGTDVNFTGFVDDIVITKNGGNSLILDLEDSAVLSFNPSSSTIPAVGGTVDVSIDLGPITGLYGYDVRVNYDSSKVSASGAFLTFLDTTTNAIILAPYNAVCTNDAPPNGECKFAVTKQYPAEAVNGTGALAKITFTAKAPGVVNLTFGYDVLSDRNGFAILHTAGTGIINVTGMATFNGFVGLQGRVTPMNTGTVTLTDQEGKFPPTVATFLASNGSWTATVPVWSTGSNYVLSATHLLYLDNATLPIPVTNGGVFAPFPSPTQTMLKGGDANNSGKVEVDDLTCIGGAFGGPPTVCGSNGNTDINNDGVTNILDLTILGGNYDLGSPRPW